jgi:hypothetical protein
MTDPDNTATAGGASAPGRPALAEARLTDRPVRDPDPARNAAYWARIDRIVAAAPPLTDEQKAVIRTAFHAPRGPAASSTPPATSAATSAVARRRPAESKEAA